MYVCMYVTLFIAKIAAKGLLKLCKAQPRKRGAFGAPNAYLVNICIYGGKVQSLNVMFEVR